MCIVPSTGNINHIQWHYIRNCSEIGVNVLHSNITPRCSRLIDRFFKCNTSVQPQYQNSILTIFNLNSVTSGYYWCTVYEIESIPSQVVHIQHTGSYNSRVSGNATILSHVSCLSTPRCTDDKNQIISLVEAQNLACHDDVSTTRTLPTVDTTEQTTATNESFPVEIVWLVIAAVLALLLLGVVILLAIIAALWCKKRKVKGEPGY